MTFVSELEPPVVWAHFDEILTNVARHAGADQVEVALRMRDGMLEMDVRDNGKGFEPGDRKGKSTLGILGMRERALVCGGEVVVRGEKNRGTTVSVVVPLSE